MPLGRKCPSPNTGLGEEALLNFDVRRRLMMTISPYLPTWGLEAKGCVQSLLGSINNSFPEEILEIK